MVSDKTEQGGNVHIEEGDRQKTGRRQILRYLTGGALGPLVFPRWFSQAQEVQSRTGRKAVVGNTEKAACEYDSIVPNTKPRWKAGRTFRYRTTKSDAKQAGLPIATAGKPGKVLLRGEPIPLQQTITVGKNAEFGGENCVLIERKGVLDYPSPGRGAEDQSKSYINAQGKIRYSESVMTVTDGQSTSVSTNRSSDFTPISDLHFFYGYWMLALGPDFSWECSRNTSEGMLFQKLKVTDMAALGGRECFVVERTYRTESQGSEVTSYWVDKKERIAVQVKKGNCTVRLVS
jgi:hypothetical protein